MPRRSTRPRRDPARSERRSPADWYADNKRRIDVGIIAVALAGFGAAGWVTQLDGDSSAEEPRPASRTDRVAGDEPSTAAATAAPLPSGIAGRIAAALQVTDWGELDPSLDELRARPEGCTNVEPATVDDCAYGDPAATRTAVVLGDSVAMAWVPAVRAALGDGWRVQMLTRSECPATAAPTWRNRTAKGEVYAACTEHKEWARAEIARLRPDLVVTSSLPEFANRVVGVDESELARKYDVWREGIAELVRDLGRSADRVVVLGAPPSSGNLQTCVTARSEPADCVKPVTRHWSAVATAESAGARAGGGRHVSPLDWFCFDGRCPAVVGSTPVMRDGTHVTPAYAMSLAALLRPALTGAA